MARNLCPDRERATIAVGATILALAVPSAAGQICAILGGGAIGWGLLRNDAAVQSGQPLVIRLPRRWSRYCTTEPIAGQSLSVASTPAAPRWAGGIGWPVWM